MGMNFADIAMLKLSNIINDRIIYKRAKTGKNYSIKLSPPVNEILSNYLPGKGPDDFIFPIITRDTLVLQMQDRQNQRKIYTKNLKKIASECKLGGNLTGYVARHSWATIAKGRKMHQTII